MNHIEQTEDLLRRLMESYLFFPRDLHIEPKGDGARTDFVVEVHPDDQKLAIGYRGCHIKAMFLILALIGRAEKKDYRFVLVDRVPQLSERAAPIQAQRYDPFPARNLLLETLKAIFEDTPIVEMTGSDFPPLNYTFLIRCAGENDWLRLTSSIRRDDLTLEGALGTIFRAWANKDGVVFKIATS